MLPGRGELGLRSRPRGAGYRVLAQALLCFARIPNPYKAKVGVFVGVFLSDACSKPPFCDACTIGIRIGISLPNVARVLLCDIYRKCQVLGSPFPFFKSAFAFPSIYSSTYIL